MSLELLQHCISYQFIARTQGLVYVVFATAIHFFADIICLFPFSQYLDNFLFFQSVVQYYPILSNPYFTVFLDFIYEISLQHNLSYVKKNISIQFCVNLKTNIDEHFYSVPYSLQITSSTFCLLYKCCNILAYCLIIYNYKHTLHS